MPGSGLPIIVEDAPARGRFHRPSSAAPFGELTIGRAPGSDLRLDDP
jgi:hypothetical protein